MTLFHDFSSWLLFMTSLHDFLSNSLHSFSSWLSIIALYHSSLSKLSIKQSSCFSSCSSLWLYIKKIMQRRKFGKISIFSSLDIIFDFLTSRVENSNQVLTRNRYQIESECWNRVFKSSQKIDIEYSSWIRRLISKLDLIISLIFLKVIVLKQDLRINFIKAKVIVRNWVKLEILLI